MDHHDATIDSHMHTDPRTGDSHQPHPSDAHPLSTQLQQNHSALHFLCLLLPFYRLALFSGLFLHVTLISTFGYPHCSLYFQRARAHTRSTPGGRVPHCARTSAVAFVHGGKCNQGLEIHGRKKTKDGCARRFCPCLNSAPFPGSLGRCLGVGLRCRQTVTKHPVRHTTHRALVPPFLCFILTVFFARLGLLQCMTL